MRFERNVRRGRLYAAKSGKLVHGKPARIRVSAEPLVMARAGAVTLAGCSGLIGTGPTSANVEPAAAPCAASEGRTVYHFLRQFMG